MKGNNMSQSILRLPDVIIKTGLSRSSIYNSIKSGNFPDRVSLGPRATGWRSTDIDEWIESRISVNNPPRKTNVTKRIGRTINRN